MSSKVINGDIQICRSSDNFVRIRFEDNTSHTKFAEAKLSLEQFAEAVTGMYVSDVEIEVRGLEYVGKQKVSERRSVFCPLNGYKKEELRDWLIENCQEDGWFINSYLGSQSSVKSVDGGTQLNYAVYKYVDI